MTHAQLLRGVARRTGDSVRTLRRLGFQPEPAPRRAPDAGGLRLVVDCPFCGRPVPYPGRAAAPATAECAGPRCDVYFDFAPADVYAARA